MRITGKIAQDMSRYAHDISGFRVAVCHVGGDIGNGARIIDGNEQLVWLGEPRHATAYYLGQIDAYRATLGITDDLPADVARVRAEILQDDRRARVMTWYQRGVDVGTLRASRQTR